LVQVGIIYYIQAVHNYGWFKPMIPTNILIQ